MVAKSNHRDHLRVCGADHVRVPAERNLAGSPPRVRSRREVGHQVVFHVGITSACAEQTLATTNPTTTIGDHLRVCGADDMIRADQQSADGSPPRVRSRPTQNIQARSTTGITSACAEQTAMMGHWRNRARDHLRVCGADATLSTTNFLSVGSPPRVRSRLACAESLVFAVGITSACAEQTTGRSDR